MSILFGDRQRESKHCRVTVAREEARLYPSNYDIPMLTTDFTQPLRWPVQHGARPARRR